MIVVLLNVLIAQMSYTYSKLQENNDGTFNIIRARSISSMQKVWPIPIHGKVRNYPGKAYTVVSRLLVPIAICSLHSITRHVINERHSSS